MLHIKNIGRKPLKNDQGQTDQPIDQMTNQSIDWQEDIGTNRAAIGAENVFLRQID